MDFKNGSQSINLLEHRGFSCIAKVTDSKGISIDVIYRIEIAPTK